MFLDEVNTSSCLGLFKEIIVDRTFDGNVSGPQFYQPGYMFEFLVQVYFYTRSSPPPPHTHILQPIPDNVFIVAACNPHRSNSLASHSQKETWVWGSYYVRQLHPTLNFLMWDYGSLDESQERDYINAKMKMLNRNMPNAEVCGFVGVRVCEVCAITCRQSFTCYR